MTNNINEIISGLQSISNEIDELNKAYAYGICKINQSQIKITQATKRISELASTQAEYFKLKKELNEITQGTAEFMSKLADCMKLEKEILR